MCPLICVDSKRGKDAPLTHQSVGKSEQKNLLVRKSFTKKAKLLILVSYLCVDLQRGKDTLLTDKSMGQSKEEDLPIHRSFT